MSNPKRLRGIAETIAAARASLDEPSRPFTPSNLDNRMSLDSGSRGPSRTKTKLESMILPNNSSMLTNNVSGSGKSTSEYQSFMLQLRDLGDAVRSIDLETTHFINAASLETIGSYITSVIKSSGEVSKVIRKSGETVVSSGIRDILSVGSDMIDLLNKWTNEFVDKVDLDLQYPLCRCTLRFYLDLVKVSKTKEGKAPSYDLVKPLQRISGMIYRLLSNQKGGALIGIHHDSAVHTLLLDLLEILWRRLPACLKTVLTSSGPDSDSSDLLLLLESGKYAAGSLRILSKDDTDQKTLVRCKAVEYIATGVKIVCLIPIKQLQKSIDNSGPNADAHRQLMDAIADTLVQLLGAIRNLSVDKDNHAELLQFETVGSLCCLLTLFSAYPTVQLNCARVTAKLSLFEPFRAQINSESKVSTTSSSSSGKSSGSGKTSGGNVCLKQFSAIVLDQARQTKITAPSGANEGEEGDGDWPAWHTWLLLSRVCFTLGNLTTTNDVNRRVIGIEYKVAGSLVDLLKACSGALLDLHNNRGIEGDNDDPQEDDAGDNDNSYMEDKDDNAAEEELRDATIKMLRLLANLSIESEIGMELTVNTDILDLILLKLLGATSEEVKHEELLLNTVATCTNITFFACLVADNKVNVPSAYKSTREGALSPMEAKLVELSSAVTQYLFHDNDEIVLETTRVLGNLTRVPSVLASIVRHRTDEALILLLRHGNVDIVASVAGTLVNLSADPTSKKSLLDASSNVFEKFAELLRKISIRHIQLHTLICQTLHNLLVTNSSITSLKDRSDFVHVSHSIQDSLTEKVDIVEDYTEEEYVSFVRVARVVLKQLFALG